MKPADHSSPGLAIRAIRAGDEAAVVRMLERLSQTSAYRRFFSPLPHLDAVFVEQFCTADDRDRQVVLAVAGDEVVGVAHASRLDTASDAADIAVVVDDAWQRRGVGRRLLTHLAQEARVRGIARLVATMLADNRPVLGLARSLAPDAPREHDGAEVRLHVALPSVPIAAPPLTSDRSTLKAAFAA